MIPDRGAPVTDTGHTQVRRINRTLAIRVFHIFRAYHKLGERGHLLVERGTGRKRTGVQAQRDESVHGRDVNCLALPRRAVVLWALPAVYRSVLRSSARQRNRPTPSLSSWQSSSKCSSRGRSRPLPPSQRQGGERGAIPLYPRQADSQIRSEMGSPHPASEGECHRLRGRPGACQTPPQLRKQTGGTRGPTPRGAAARDSRA